MDVHAGKHLKSRIYYGETSTTIPEMGVKPQAIGGRKGLPLTIMLKVKK
jgi:hypothetical protein